MDPDQTLAALVFAALSVGVLHTLIEPDHYLPFAAVSRANGWSISKTVCCALLCGLGHVASSAVVGGLGLAMGAGLGAAEYADAVRGDIVKWVFASFAVVYTLFGLRRAFGRGFHVHADGSVHTDSECAAHSGSVGAKAAFWTLFAIFTLGPCEVLVPLVVYPASKGNWAGVLVVTFAFSLSSVLTMVAAVALLACGLRFVPRGNLDLSRFGGLITGLVLCVCAAYMFIKG